MAVTVSRPSSNFRRAEKVRSKLRLALCGPSGSGKTYSALAIAAALVPDGKIAVIDTEAGSSEKYAGDVAQFTVAKLDDHHPNNYISLIHEAEEDGADVVIIDSLSHEWIGTNGALEIQHSLEAKGRSSFASWAEVTPLHNRVIQTIVGASLHVIACIRSKQDYVLEPDERGRMVPRKLGLGPVQRENIEFEFDVFGMMDRGTLTVVKSRCPSLTGAVIDRPGADVAEMLNVWLNDGVGVDDSVVREYLDFAHGLKMASTTTELEQLAAQLAERITGGAYSPTQVARLRELFSSRKALVAPSSKNGSGDPKAGSYPQE